MAKALEPPEAVSALFKVLKPLEASARDRAIKATLALLGQEFEPTASKEEKKEEKLPPGLGDLDWPIGDRAKRWMTQNTVSGQSLSSIFHCNNGTFEVIVPKLTGKSKIDKARQCYLLSGVRSYLETDSPTFSDQDAVALCENMRCYDRPNNAKMRNSLGLGGSKQAGFTLTAPCLTAAADLIKELAGQK